MFEYLQSYSVYYTHMDFTPSVPVKMVINQIIENYKPEKIILFGSHADGTATKDSDYDLFMVKNTSGTIASRQKDVWNSISNWNVACDFIVYTPDEVITAKNNGSWFINQIEKKGKIIYAA